MDAKSLRSRIAGEVIEREDARFESVRRSLCWNRLVPDRSPVLLVRAAREEDLVEIVRLARSAGVRVSVRSGGHSWIGSALRDDVWLVDVGGLRDAAIDAESARAAVGPGLGNLELHRRLAPVGLTFPYGHCGSVKLAGYLLSGGLGWNGRAWNAACRNVIGVEIVTAAGERIRADESANADLFWAARGAGVLFPGIVTRFHLALHRLPPHIMRATSLHPLSRAAEVADWAAEIVARLPVFVELSVIFAAAPPGVKTPDGKCVVLDAIAFAPSPEEARRALSAVESCPVAALLRIPTGAADFEALFAGLDAALPAEHRVLADTFWFASPAGEVAAEIARAHGRAPSPKALTILTFAGRDERPGETAFALHTGLAGLCYAVWESEGDDAANRAWHDRAVAALEPLASAHYVGEADLRRPARLERCFTADTWRRLAEVAKRYDPEGMFAAPA